MGHRTTRNLWGASAVSTVGDFVAAGALLVLAFERSGFQIIGSAALFGATAAGSLVVALLGSALLDRMSRRVGLVGAQFVGAAALAAPLLLGGLWPIYLAAAVLGAVRTATAALRHGALADAVPDRLRAGLIALLGANDQFGQVIGYAAGATLAVVVSAEIALWIDIASFAVGAVLLAAAGLPGRPHVTDKPSVTRGWTTIFGHPHLRLLALLVAATALTTAVPESLATAAVYDQSRWIPAVLAAAPAGTGLGFLVIGRLASTARFGAQLTHLTLYGAVLLLGLLANSPIAWILVNLLAGAGAAWLVGPQVSFVRLGPPERMAQITATMYAMILAAEGAGSVMLGGLADSFGVGSAYGVSGAIVLVAAIGGWAARAVRVRQGIDSSTGQRLEAVKPR